MVNYVLYMLQFSLYFCLCQSQVRKLKKRKCSGGYIKVSKSCETSINSMSHVSGTHKGVSLPLNGKTSGNSPCLTSVP